MCEKIHTSQKAEQRKAQLLPLMARSEKLLGMIVEAFKGLADTVKSPTPYINVGQFARACRLVSPLISNLGIAFKFAAMEFDAKVADLAEASKSIDTLQSLLDLDIRENCARSSNSHSRNVVRVKRSVDMLRIMFEKILARGGNSITVPVSAAYEQVFGPYHGWAIKRAVAASMFVLPTKARLLKKLNEDDATANVLMQNFVDASSCVIEYIDTLFRSRGSGEDLLGLI